MKLIKRLIQGIIILIVLFVGVAFLLPRNIMVERSIDIKADEVAIFAYLNSPKKFNEWSPWATRDPKMKYEFSGPAAGKDAQMKWASEKSNVGSGTVKIIESKPNTYIKTSLDFGEEGIAESSYKLKRTKDTTRVTWGFSTDMGNNPIGRWMGLMMDSWVGHDYEEGLGRLKRLIEKGSADAK